MKDRGIMIEFNFITLNDIHISDTNPRARIDNYKTAIMDKLSQTRNICVQVKADAVLLAGDLYNNKNPARNSHRLNQELIKLFKQFPCPIYMIEGNHDLTANRIESLEEQPLGVLFADKTLHQLRHEIIEKKGKQISIVGVPYTEGLDLRSLNIPENKYLSQICVMHINASLTAGGFFKDLIYGYDELEVLSPNIFVLGHYHLDQGIYEKNGKYFVNIGSLSRGSQSEDNIQHLPQIGHIKIIIKDDDEIVYDIKSIKLKIKPAEEVFDLIKKDEEKKESKNIELFVEKLASEAIQKNSSDALDAEKIMDKMDLADIIKKRTLHFINEARLEKAKKL